MLTRSSRPAASSSLLIACLSPVLAQTPGSSPFRPQPGTSGGTSPPPGTIRESPTPPNPRGLYIVEQPGNTLLATDYIGRSVQGPGNKRVGTVSNLLVDTTGRITGVVIEVGGFLGVGTKEIALAFEAVYPVVMDDKEMFFVEMTRDQLTLAPAFKRSR
jgi:hypothetical protein